MSADGQHNDAPRRRTRSGMLPRALRAGLWMAAGAGLAVLLAAATLAVALPLLEQRPALVADWLGERLGHAVRIERLEVSWQGSSPVVRLRGVEIETDDPQAATLALDTAEVKVDALGSLRAGSVLPRSLTVRGTDLAVRRGADGSIALEGFGLAGGARADRVMGLLLDALPDGAMFALEETRISLHDFIDAGGAIVFDPVSLHLRAGDAVLRLSGALTPPGDPAATLRFSLRWQDPQRSPFQDADLTLSTRRLALSALPAGLVPSSLSGRLDLDVEAELARGEVTRLRGTTVLHEARLEAASGVLASEAVESLLELDRTDDGWTLTFLRLQARNDGRLSSPTSASVQRRVDAPPGQYTVRVDHAPLAPLLPLARGAVNDDPTVARWLQRLEPGGYLRDLAIVVAHADDGLAPKELSAGLRGIVIASADDTMRFGPADVELRVDDGSGEMRMQPAPVRLGGTGAAPITLAAGGQLGWQRDGDATVFDSRAFSLAAGPSRLHLTGGVRLPDAPDASPYLSVRGRGTAFDVADLKHYLAAAGAPATLREWIERAIPRGRLSTLNLDLDGTAAALAAFRGNLQLRAGFEDLALDYEPGWPVIEGLTGEIVMDGAQFAFTVTDGGVSGARITRASGGVEDVTRAKLSVTVDGRVSGTTQQGARFLRATPMGPRFAGLLEQLDARGPAALALALDIPLGPESTRVSGTVTLNRNSVRVAALRSALEEVNGKLRFDRLGLRDGELEANYLGRGITALMDATRSERERTELTITGDTNPAGLVRHLYDLGAVDTDEPGRLPMLSRLSGSARWQVALDIAHRDPLSGNGIGLTVSSDLAGMALRLPAPLGKERGERRPLELRTRLTESGPRLFELSYGDDTRALLERDVTSGELFRLRRGELRFGGQPVLPDAQGLRIAGRVAVLSVDDWVALIADAAPQSGLAADPMARVSGLDVTAQRLIVLGAGFDRVNVKVSRDGNGPMRIVAQGDAVDGTLEVPLPVGSGAIDARFANLVVNPDSGVERGADIADMQLDPRTLPEIRVVAERLAYADIELGLAKLSLRRSERGVDIEELFTLNDNFELRGSGSWTGSGADAASRLDLRMHSNDFGRLSKELGYGDSGADGGVSDVALTARWNGTPFDFALERISGVLHFRATEGRLREVEPGATGRVFGLLNVAVLPRRLLLLDFNDLFEEGIRYDLAEGSFRFQDGNAFSDNISLHTQTARVDLSGRIGLVAQDYDQVMTVTPKLSASLPLAPLWLAEKFLDRKLIDSAFSYRYIITGGWDAPKVERVKVKAVPTDAG